MLENFITQMLGIKEKYIQMDHVQMTDHAFHVERSTKVRRVTCCKCKHKTRRVHAYRNQRIQGRMIVEKHVILHLRKRRYKCMECGATFNEPLALVDRYQRRTASLNEQALVYASENSFTMAARMSGISTSSLLRLFDKRELPQSRVLAKVIAIDEFKGDAGKERFQTIIVDVEKKEIIEVLPDRRVETVEEYFRSCDTGNVQVVVMDMSKAFKHAVQRVFGNPVIIADRFHFMRQGYWALDRVRREVQNDLKKSDRLLSKRSKKLLWLAPEKLDEKGRKRVEELLDLHPDLKEAYRLKNALHQWFYTSDTSNVKDLGRWKIAILRSLIRSLKHSRIGKQRY